MRARARAHAAFLLRWHHGLAVRVAAAEYRLLTLPWRFLFRPRIPVSKPGGEGGGGARRGKKKGKAYATKERWDERWAREWAARGAGGMEGLQGGRENRPRRAEGVTNDEDDEDEDRQRCVYIYIYICIR